MGGDGLGGDLEGDNFLWLSCCFCWAEAAWPTAEACDGTSEGIDQSAICSRSWGCGRGNEGGKRCWPEVLMAEIPDVLS